MICVTVCHTKLNTMVEIVIPTKYLEFQLRLLVVCSLGYFILHLIKSDFVKTCF